MKEKCVEILKNIKNEFIEIGNEFKNIVEYSEKELSYYLWHLLY